MDLRKRVIETIAEGASRRETAEQFGLSASVVIIWAQRYHATGNIVPKPSGGSVSPLEEHEDFILGLIKEQPDMTLDEIVAAMKKAKIAASRTAVWRFFDRRDITFKKNSVRGRAKTGRVRPRAPTLAARAAHV
jgi:transposase